MRLSGHRSPWDSSDTRTLYRLLSGGLMHKQVAERLGRTKRAILWKINRDRRASAAVDTSLQEQPVFEKEHNSRRGCSVREGFRGKIKALSTKNFRPLARPSLET